MIRRVAIFGSMGQLGTDLVEILRQDEKFDVVPLGHQDADCRKEDQVRKVLANLRPDTVINCAAYVRVDDCEDHVEEAFGVNAIGAHHIAKACAEIDACCVYISTDYVFDGTKEAPYVESDAPNPINVYGASKLAGEHLTRLAAARWLIVRVSSLFGKTGARGKGGNFVETILAKAKQGEALKVVDDIRVSPTYTRDAARAVRRLLENSATGAVHAANGGSCTWYEFAKAILALSGMKVAIEPVPSRVFLSRARRPRNSALGNALMPVEVHSWQDALKEYLFERGHSSADAGGTPKTLIR